MDKVIIKRGSIILGIILAIIGLTVVFSLLLQRDNSPRLTDPNGPFVTVNGVTLTNQEWFDEAKAADGINQLLNMIDETLLASEMAAVTQDEIDETILRLTYGTTDLDEINQLSDFEKQQRDQDYLDLIVISGFDPDDASSVERFVRLTSAREEKAKALILESLLANEEVSSIRHLDAFKEYYEDNEKGSLKAIVLRFRSLNELNGVLRMNNLVLGFEGGMGLYFGETPIEDVPTDGFNDENTRLLSDAEVLNYYLIMDNYLNPFLSTLPTNVTRSDLATLNFERLNYTYSEMLDVGSANMTSLANFLFTTLRSSDTLYSTSSRTIGTERVLAYIFDNPITTLLENIEDAAEFEEAFLDSLITAEGVVQRELAKFRETLGFEIHDEDLAATYLQSTQVDAFNENRDRSLIANIGDLEVTVDEFFVYLNRRIGALYSLDLVRNELLLQSEGFEALYGTNRDLFRNSSEAMVAFRDQIRQDKLAFSNGFYAQFGFGPDNFTWEDFLRAGYGLESEYDYLLTLALTDVRRNFVNDRLTYDMALPYLQENQDNYLSLEVKQLLLFVDMDQDFVPDDFEEYYEDLSAIEKAQVERTIAQFEDLVTEAIDSGLTLEDILTAFNNGLRSEDPDNDDYSDWAQFKNQGFYIIFENLSAEEPLTLDRSRSFVRPFLDGLIDFYGRYQLPENIDQDELLNDRLIRTQFGLHMILGEPGPDFEKPSYVLTSADIEAYIEYITENGSNFQSQEALNTALLGEFGADRFNAINAYYRPFYERALGNTYFNSLLIEDLASEITYTIDQSYHVNILRTLGEIFNRRSFTPLLSELE